MPVRLTRETVIVWEADLDELSHGASGDADMLSPRERRRADRLRDERDRRRFSARRTFLRVVLGSHLDRDPASIQFESAAGGKPVVADTKDLHFNASSAGRIALVAVSGAALGVDVEEIHMRSDIRGLARRWLSADEQAGVRRLDPSQRPRDVFAYLTRKEAALNAAGVGLGLDPSLSSGPAGVEVPVLIDVPAPKPSSWWVTPLPMPGDMVGALATCDPAPWVIRLGRDDASAP